VSGCPQVNSAAAAVNQRSGAGNNASQGSNHFHNFPRRAACGDHVFHDKAALARLDRKPAPQGHSFFLALGEKRSHAQSARNFVRHNNSAQCRSDHQINPADFRISLCFLG